MEFVGHAHLDGFQPIQAIQFGEVDVGEPIDPAGRHILRSKQTTMSAR